MANKIESIAELKSARSAWTDEELLSELAATPPLADENDSCWQDESYWQTANLYLALADLTADRKLRPAIKLLLERASYGDPNEIMRGLRHNLEAIVNPDWSYLTDVCLEAAQSSRLGTRLWAISELAILDDARAKSILEEAVKTGPDEIRLRAESGLRRLAEKNG
jgi:hypothetical protein